MMITGMTTGTITGTITMIMVTGMTTIIIPTPRLITRLARARY
jgi:hypothetical protein